MYVYIHQNVCIEQIYIYFRISPSLSLYTHTQEYIHRCIPTMSPPIAASHTMPKHTINTNTHYIHTGPNSHTHLPRCLQQLLHTSHAHTTHNQTRIHKHTYTHTHTHTFALSHPHTHTHTHTYAHTHTQKHRYRYTRTNVHTLSYEHLSYHLQIL